MWLIATFSLDRGFVRSGFRSSIEKYKQIALSGERLRAHATHADERTCRREVRKSFQIHLIDGFGDSNRLFIDALFIFDR